MMRALAAILILAPDGLTVTEFEKLHKELMVREPWRSVPWKVSVRQARELSVRENKPIFLWQVEGNPVGGTG